MKLMLNMKYCSVKDRGYQRTLIHASARAAPSVENITWMSFTGVFTDEKLDQKETNNMHAHYSKCKKLKTVIESKQK